MGMEHCNSDLLELLLSLVPQDGGKISIQALREQFLEPMRALQDESTPTFDRLLEALIEDGILVQSKGRKATVQRVRFPRPVSSTSPADSEFALGPSPAPQPEPELSAVTAKTKRSPAASPRNPNGGEAQVLSYRHSDKRKNNPEVGMVKPENDPEQPKTAWHYDPHLDPALQFDSNRAAIEKLIDEALASGDDAAMRAALEELKRLQQPYLNWTGKAERTSFEIDTVSLHVHERIEPATILSALSKRIKDAKGKDLGAWLQPDMFSAPFENLPLRYAYDFYKHERGWANRLIAGDSLLVMNSLIQKESMAGQVQMIYIDPPYGIKYGSNFQPFVNKRDVKDRKDEDLTQEPEMIKAFRDTWELGIRSYLTYLRDRLLLAKELLHESGSVFVQILDENLHHTKELLDEIFGPITVFASLPSKKRLTQLVRCCP